MTGITGVVLAGGRSSRMGNDKALLLRDGMRLVDGAVSVLSAFCDDVVVASGARQIADLSVPQVPDPIAHAGPLGGIVAGLATARGSLVAVLAVDLPDASAAVFTALIDRAEGEAAVIPVVDGRPQPLHAIWSVRALPALRDLLSRGERRVQEAAEVVGAAFVPMEGNFARNVNRPLDLGTDGTWTTG